MLAFAVKVLDWKVAQGMTFTEIQLCARDAIEWSEGVKEFKEKQSRRKGF